MKSTDRRTLLSIFSDPLPRSLEWHQIELLFIAMGAQVIEGRGSRVRFMIGDVIGTFHRPHPSKDAKPYQIRDARSFLLNAGVRIEKGMTQWEQ
jgi:hypothetical protein